MVIDRIDEIMAGFEEAGEHLHEIGMELINHPLALRFNQKSKASGTNKIHTPEDVLGERYGRLGALCLIEHHNPGWLIMGVNEAISRSAAIAGFVTASLRSPAYLWTDDVRKAVAAAADLPTHVISPRILPTPTSWWTFETGINIGGKFREGGDDYQDIVVDAAVVADYKQGVLIWTVGEVTKSSRLADRERHPEEYKSLEEYPNRQILLQHMLPYGRTYPDGFPDPGEREQARGILGMLSFLNSPYIPKRQERLSRAARRDCARAGAPAEDIVTFVVLRRPTTPKRSPGEETAIEWKHQWIVSGHYRAQWYPSERAHHVIWIAPYLKGPEDKPMLEHAFKVAR